MPIIIEITNNTHKHIHTHAHRATFLQPWRILKKKQQQQLELL